MRCRSDEMVIEIYVGGHSLTDPFTKFLHLFMNVS